MLPETYVLCLQETHRGLNHKRPRIHGMKLSIESTDEEYGSAIFGKNNNKDTTSTKNISDIEIVSLTNQRNNHLLSLRTT
jgi:hypothetical protein